MKILRLKMGSVAVIENDTHISKWVRQSGRLDHDQNMLPLLNGHIQSGFTVVDIGAYIGDHTEYYANRVGSSGKVYAFEPNPPAFECLKYNMTKHAQVFCLNFGASDSNHTIGIALDPNVGASHAIEGDEIKCIELDSLKLNECHFIKMDCEGMELRALIGAQKTISMFRPTMLLEINRGALIRQGVTADDVFGWLENNQYYYRNVYYGQSLLGEQLDILCLPK